jgi:hypothetical protein
VIGIARCPVCREEVKTRPSKPASVDGQSQFRDQIEDHQRETLPVTGQTPEEYVVTSCSGSGMQHWRAQIHILFVERGPSPTLPGVRQPQVLYVQVPGWSPNDPGQTWIAFPVQIEEVDNSQLLEILKQVHGDYRCHAHVFFGAERWEDLQPVRWEWS